MLIICVCFKIYFLIDHHYKTSWIRLKILKFLHGVVLQFIHFRTLQNQFTLNIFLLLSFEYDAYHPFVDCLSSGVGVCFLARGGRWGVCLPHGIVGRQIPCGQINISNKNAYQHLFGKKHLSGLSKFAWITGKKLTDQWNQSSKKITVWATQCKNNGHNSPQKSKKPSK